MPANHKELVHNDYLHIKLPSALKEDFYGECARDEMVASTVVRQLMRSYINRRQKARQNVRRRHSVT